ncbi:gas vesicle protein GvpG [Saccharomonospora azurea]|uniref:Gas vesicle protein G n=1 Tax=Saccharomonospora azurea NA-128 TaxID=882081 RepID=H8G5C0_9PSEU|nr:gas vesicle protein GvpG [Saccharomonospora azurea]EHY87174.1 Gas vesicle protein G [Saccharomonospora azurea NA-128]
MGLVTTILGLPLAPVRAVVSLADVIREQVDRELYDPASVRRELEAAEEARAAGEITAEEEAEIQQRALGRLTGYDGTDPGSDIAGER